VVDFVNGTAKSAIDLGGKSPFLQDFTFPSPRIAVLDNNLYYQYAVLAHCTIGRLAAAGLSSPDSSRHDAGKHIGGIDRPAAGRQHNTNLARQFTDLEILLYLDAGRRLMRVDVPSSKATIERE